MIKCCIFDLDGTLLDTVTTIAYYVNKTVTAEGIAPITEDECRIFVGNGARKLIERTLNSRGVTDADALERILKKYNDDYDSDPYYLTEPYPGIPELIDSLREMGYTVAVLSNKPESTVKQIVSHYFGDRFAIVRGGRDTASLKPLPKSTLEMLSEMGESSSELAFIGDTSVDILTAKNAGAALAIGVSWGFRGREELEESGADVIADRAEDILRFVRGGV